MTDEQDHLLADIRTGAWLDAQTFPPLSYAVPGIIPEGSTLLVGAPKIGKSFLTLSCALAAAAGGRALGVVEVEQRPVLYLALEDGDRRMQERCRSLLDDAPIPAAFEYVTTVQHGLVLPTIAAWLKKWWSYASPLVVLDTLGKVMPPAAPGESAYQRDYRIGTGIKALCTEHPGASIVTVHHDRKAGSDDFVDAVSGTHGLAGAADTIVVLHRPRHEQRGTLNVTGRDVLEAEYAVENTRGAWRLVGGSLDDAQREARTSKATAGLGDRSAEIIAYVNRQPGGVRIGDVADALGLDTDTAGVYLRRAVTAERLVKVGRGLYASSSTPVLSVLSVRSKEGEHSETNTKNGKNRGTGRRCDVCGFPLEPDLDDETTHATCGPDGAA